MNKLFTSLLIAGLISAAFTSEAQTKKSSKKSGKDSKKVEVPSAPEVAGIRMVIDKPGETAKEGYLMKANYAIRNFKDSVLQNTYAMGNPIVSKVPQPNFKGDLGEYMAQLSAGDSAVISIPSDSLFQGQGEAQRPPFIPKGSLLKFGIKVYEVYSEPDFKKAQLEELRAWGEKEGLKVIPSVNGYYFAIKTEGTGAKIKSGDEAEVHYTGKFMNGEVFDSSVPRGQTFNVTVGQGRVIKGWDLGLQELKEGSFGYLLLPYDLAYGEYGSPPKIAPYSPLIFEIEVVKVKRK